MLSSVWWGYVSQMHVYYMQCIASIISLTKKKRKKEKEKEHTINRWTNVLFSCPIRCTRLTAWASSAGLSSGSTRTTCCASNRLSPLAPCWIKSSNTWTDFVSCWCLSVLLGLLFCALNSLIATCDFLHLWSHNQKTW
jgi:hypothetical protein